MSYPKPLKKPKVIQVPGFGIRCRACRSQNLNGSCGKTGKSMRTCKHTEDQVFFNSIVIPGTGGNIRRKKDFPESRDPEQTAFMMLQWRKKMANCGYQPHIETDIETETRPEFIMDCVALWIDVHVEQNNVLVHKRKSRSKIRKDEMVREVKRFLKVLQANQYDLGTLKITDIGDREVSIFYKHLHSLRVAQKMAAVSFNKTMYDNRAFFDWFIEREYDIANPFKGITKAQSTKQPLSFPEVLFWRVCHQIEIGDPVRIVGKRQEKKNMYRDWVTEYCILRLYTGMRRENLFAVQLGDIEENVIKVDNIKVNKIIGAQFQDERRHYYVPIFPALRMLLDYLKKRISDHGLSLTPDTFLIAPWESHTITDPAKKIGRRKSMMVLGSKSFNHFLRQIEPETELTFDNLRKTYITQVNTTVAVKTASQVAGHSKTRVTVDNYIDQAETARQLSRVNLFDVAHLQAFLAQKSKK